MVKKQIVLDASNSFYKSHFMGYLRYCKAETLQPFKTTSIVPFVKALKEGYPNGKPKSAGTIRNKTLSIKRHFKLNNRDIAEFKDLNKEIQMIVTA